jgi:alkylhydroperoxidase/carboxymuconolactone decarboxylase family protein YurZ
VWSWGLRGGSRVRDDNMTAKPTRGTEPWRDSDRWEQGLDAFASQFQIAREEVTAWFTERVGDRLGEEAIYSSARAWTDDVLSLRDRSLAVLASLITMGGAEGQLRTHARWAIEHGCTQSEIEAMAALLAVYVGFARAANGLIIIREELAKLGSPSATSEGHVR